MQRLDTLITDRQLTKSRSQAQAAIQNGRVEAYLDGNWKTITKPGQKVPEDTDIRVTEDVADKYVSRGALKLEAALTQLKLSLSGFQVLDIGQSTGGFTDCALQFGASKVVGVEVGHDQLDKGLRGDERVVCLEKINARNLSHSDLGSHFPAEGFDMIVMDVSFISQTKILPNLPTLLRPGGVLITLVKPQFEVGKEGIGKGGIVRDSSLFEGVKVRIQSLIAALGLETQHYMSSPIKGGDGNQEFILIAAKH